MASLDTNIIIIALPAIASDLHTSLLTLIWIVLGYWLVTAAVLMNLGRLSDMLGRVRLYNVGFIVFTIGSALCSISQTGEQLMLFRVVQALGAAFLFSNSAAIITDAFPEKERGRALGLNQVSIVAGRLCSRSSFWRTFNFLSGLEINFLDKYLNRFIRNYLVLYKITRVGNYKEGKG
jgi:MFS family permease